MLVFIILLCIFGNQSSLTSGCKLPQHPANGKWQVPGLTPVPSPGDTVSAGSGLFVTCNEGYKLWGSNVGLCVGEQFQWQIKMGHCLKTCPELTETDKVKVTCRLKDESTGDIAHVKCSEATNGTVAQFECAEHYTITVENSTESFLSGGSGLSKCKAGKWTADRPNCNPNCGLKSLTGATLSVQGKTAKKGSYPWQVAIYNYDKEKDESSFSCGGSMINERVVITAAHCVADNYGNVQPIEKFRIAGGKYYQNWTDKRDSEDFQPNKIKEVLVPKRYKGTSQNFYGDLAILIMDEPFKFNDLLQPICMDWNKIYRSQFLTPMNIGYVSGWGVVSETGAIVDELQEIELPYVTNEVCAKAISELDQGYLTEDKLCLGYVNQSKGVCAGDSGGALVFKSSFDNRYYLTGIVSISPDVEFGARCNSQLYSLFTEVYSYIDFIREKTAEYQSSVPQPPPTSKPNTTPHGTTTVSTTTTASPEVLEATCGPPPQLANGTWEISARWFTSENRTRSGAPLEYKCNDGYKLSGDSLHICMAGKWSGEVPTCLRLCPPLDTVYRCERGGTNTWAPTNCSTATDGTIATVECDTNIGGGDTSVLDKKRAFSVCSRGNWSTVNCNQECGKGNETAHPWKVAIYKEADDASPKFICGGVLISERIILTEYACVSDIESDKSRLEKYTVVVGNNYVDFNDTRDASTIQIFKLKKARIPQTLSGKDYKYFLGNIAVLVTNKCVEMTENVQPACLDHLSELAERQLEGLVVGWGDNKFNSSNPKDNVELSRDVKVVKVKTVSMEKCQLKGDNTTSLLSIKNICVGYPRDESKRICTGDEGNGLVVKNPRDGRHYVLGLASVAQDEACGDMNRFNRISDYMEYFIIEALLSYLPSKESCASLLVSDDVEENDPFGRDPDTFIFSNGISGATPLTRAVATLLG